MATGSEVADFTNENLGWIIIIIAMVFGMFILYRKVRKIPQNPDFIKIFHESMIGDESLNKRDKVFGLKWLYRGEQLIGRILTVSQNDFLVPKKSSIPDIGKSTRDGRPYELKREDMKIATITFKRPLLNLGITRFYRMKKDILKFTNRDNFRVEEKGKLVFPSDCSFTALGNVYATMNSYQQVSSVILDQYNKNLMVATNNLMAGEMQKVSSMKPEFAHALVMKDKEIQALREAKQAKMSGVI